MHFIHLFFFQSNGREIRHVILTSFKSNARETWCVILVSVSWHTLLSITAHLYFVLFLRSLWFFHNIATLLICAHQLVSLFYHVTTTLRTWNFGRFLPGHEIAIRIVLASVIFSAFFRLFQNNIFSTFRAGYTYLLKIWFCITTLREAWAGKESAM